MSLNIEEGKAVHYAKNGVFEFDEEVAQIFDNMAERSIPMYSEVHRMHLDMYRYLLSLGRVVVDVGSSTGKMFRTAEEVLGMNLGEAGVDCIAIDSSAPMMSRLLAEHPYVEGIVASIPSCPNLENKADLMFCMYVLQFVPMTSKIQAIRWLADNLARDGVLVIGQKDTMANPHFANDFTEQYHAFRRANGYTQKEIDAKTQALASSMWTSESSFVAYWLRAFGLDVQESSRWLQFSTIIATRKSTYGTEPG